MHQRPIAPATRAPRLCLRVLLDSDEELHFWLELLGVQEDDLRRAVFLVGCDADVVAEYLSRPH